MSRRSVATGSSACVALLAAGGVLAGPAQAATAEARTTNSVCTRAYGSVQRLPALVYGDRLLAALTTGNRLAAGCYGAGPLVRALGAEGVVAGTTWTRVASDAGWGYLHSTYADGTGRSVTIAILLGDRQPGGWHAVDAATLEATTGPVSGYTDKLLHAWRLGDRELMAELAAGPAFDALWTHPGPRGTWTRDRVRVEDTGTWVDYHLDAQSLSLRINVIDALASRPQAVKTATFG